MRRFRCRPRAFCRRPRATAPAGVPPRRPPWCRWRPEHLRPRQDRDPAAGRELSSSTRRSLNMVIGAARPPGSPHDLDRARPRLPVGAWRQAGRCHGRAHASCSIPCSRRTALRCRCSAITSGTWPLYFDAASRRSRSRAAVPLLWSLRPRSGTCRCTLGLRPVSSSPMSWHEAVDLRQGRYGLYARTPRSTPLRVGFGLIEPRRAHAPQLPDHILDRELFMPVQCKTSSASHRNCHGPRPSSPSRCAARTSAP